MPHDFYIGIDVGGTKIASGLVSPGGQILIRDKIPTPKNASGDKLAAVIEDAVDGLLGQNPLPAKGLQGIGLGVPGIVDAEGAEILSTPNIRLAGAPLAAALKKRFKTKVLIGNDVNLGLLGETWLGAGQDAGNIIGIFPGTGIGGAIVLNGHLHTGSHGLAGEIGHMTIDLNGPECTCGNRGCLEAFAGRWAIERDIRAALLSKETSIIPDLLEGDLTAIKSKTLKRALKKYDPLVTRIIENVSHILGLACISLKHLLNPEMIIFGGGLIEACGDFILPIIRKTVDGDPFFENLEECEIIPSQLGDDAVLLGAVALVNSSLDLMTVPKDNPAVTLVASRDGQVFLNGNPLGESTYVRADGKVKKLNGGGKNGTALPADTLRKICKKSPELLILCSDKSKALNLDEEGKAFLKAKNVTCKILSVKEGISLYNSSAGKKAVVIKI